MGNFLKPSSPTCCTYFRRDDPSGSGGEAPVVGHEIGPGLLEPEAHAARVRHLDRGDPVLHRLRRRAPIALEGELHVVGGDGLAVVELRALAQHELVDEAVLGQAPRLGQARRHGVAGHRLHHRVVQRVEHHVRRAGPGRLRGVEPGRGERDVNGPGHLPFGRRVARRGLGGRDPEDEQRREGGSRKGLACVEGLLSLHSPVSWSSEVGPAAAC